jgi:LysM repeat protein
LDYLSKLHNPSENGSEEVLGIIMNRKIQVALLLLVFCLMAVSANASIYLQPGSTGAQVREVQNYLYSMGYLRVTPDGNYGPRTTESVKAFQIEYGLTYDGRVGDETYTALKEAAENRRKYVDYTVLASDTLAAIAEKHQTSVAIIMVENRLATIEITSGQKLRIPLTIRNSRPVSRGRAGGVQAIPWSIVDKLWPAPEAVRIIDVLTGKTVLIKRQGGYFHADSEPMTPSDTQTLLELYDGKWSWGRRAVIVQVRQFFIAASMNGMPHGRDTLPNNNYRGQFCIHFLGSRIHKHGGSIDPLHQKMVENALQFDLEQWQKTQIKP